QHLGGARRDSTTQGPQVECGQSLARPAGLRHFIWPGHSQANEFSRLNIVDTAQETLDSRVTDVLVMVLELVRHTNTYLLRSPKVVAPGTVRGAGSSAPAARPGLRARPPRAGAVPGRRPRSDAPASPAAPLTAGPAARR